MMPVMLRRGLLGVCALALVACDGPTQLLVIVDSDLGGPLAFVDVSASSGLLSTGRRFDVAATGLPFSFAVVPADEAVEEVSIRAAAMDAEGATLVAYDVQTRFVQGQTLRVEIPLARACRVEPSCADHGMRCVHGVCEERFVDPGSLPRGGGAPSSLFDGTDPLPDAGPEPMTDGGCGAPCADPESPCRIGVVQCDVDAPGCAITETLPAGADCGDGRVCDAEGQCGI